MRVPVLSVVGLAMCSAAFAEGTDGGVVSGSGVVTISRAPETMRVQIALLGKGSGLKEALASLKKRAEAAREQLGDLGAVKDSIKVEPARIHRQQNDRQRQMEAMMAARLRRGSKAPAKSAVTPPVTVAANVTAEWKLDAKAGEDLLLAVHPLQEKIRAADLAGAKEAEKLTPEQEELAEEMEAGSYNAFGGEEQKPGDPVFLFVSRVSEEEHAKALAEAFRKAKASASRLAAAAGSDLGGLRSVSNSEFPATDDGEGGYAYNSPVYRAMQMARVQQSQGKEDANEAVGAEPGPVKFHVKITASFDLKK